MGQWRKRFHPTYGALEHRCEADSSALQRKACMVLSGGPLETEQTFRSDVEINAEILAMRRLFIDSHFQYGNQKIHSQNLTSNSILVVSELLLAPYIFGSLSKRKWPLCESAHIFS